MDHATIRQFISQHRYAVLSSLSPNNTPQSALIGIAVSENLEIIFDTVKSSRKYPNLIASPNCSVVIGWENEQTLQLEGLAYEPQGENLTLFRNLARRSHSPPLARLGSHGRPSYLAPLQRLQSIPSANFRAHLPPNPPLNSSAKILASARIASAPNVLKHKS